MNLYDSKIVVAIENAVCNQLEASGITADPFRLNGEKVIGVILEQIEGFVLVPMVPSERIVNAVRQCYEGEAYLPYSLYSEFINQAMIEAHEQKA